MKESHIRTSLLLSVMAGAVLTLVSCGGSSNSDAPPEQNTPPVISKQPEDVTFTAGSDVTASFRVIATGRPSPTYQWLVSTDGLNWNTIDRATSATYSFSPQDSDNNTYYEVKVTNTLGSVTSRIATLTVANRQKKGPKIFLQPKNETVYDWAPALTLGVGVEEEIGIKLSYQWYRSKDGKNWSIIQGADYYIYQTAVSSEDNGTYYKVVVTSKNGSTTSDIVRLTFISSK